MADAAYAVSITEENRWAIASEHPNFDEDEFELWVDDEDAGFFIRDPNSPFDCQYIDRDVFKKIYRFEHDDHGVMFRQIRMV